MSDDDEKTCPRCGHIFREYSKNGVERGCPACFVVLKFEETLDSYDKRVFQY